MAGKSELIFSGTINGGSCGSPLFYSRAFLRQSSLVRGSSFSLSSAMIYEFKEEADPSAEPLLIAVKVVPNAGVFGSTKLVPVVDVEGEAVIRTYSRHSKRRGQALPSIYSFAEERWQARLKNMSPEKRKKVEEKMRDERAKQAARQEQDEKRKAEREAREAERQARRDAKDEELRISDPERYEERMQHREEIRQRILEENAADQIVRASE